MLSLVKYLPTVLVALGTVIGLLSMLLGAVSTVMRMLPAAWITYVERKLPRVAWFARAARKFGLDALPVLQAMYKGLAGHPYDLGAQPTAAEALAAVPRQPAPPNSHGFATARSMAIAFLVACGVLFAGAVVHGCSGTQLERDMHAADDLGLVANRAEPVWMNAYRLDGQHAADAVCANTADAACVQLRLAAVRAVEARWMHVRRQWETAVSDHDALSGCLEAAHRTDGGGICPDQAAKQAALTASMMTYRCTVHAIGHAELDPLGSNGLVCPGAVTDGGAL